MRCLLIGDLHGELSALATVVFSCMREKLDLVILTGDLADLPSPAFSELQSKDFENAKSIYGEQLKSLFGLLKTLKIPVVYVPGNHDLPVNEIKDELVFNVDGLTSCEPYKSTMSGVVVLGIGGSNRTPFHGPYEWNDRDSIAFEKVYKQIEQTQTTNNFQIILSHCPPKWSKFIDVGGANRNHIGSELVRGVIETYHPRIMLTGHVHEASGVDLIDQTLLINAGSLKDVIRIRFPNEVGASREPTISDICRYIIFSMDPEANYVTVSIRGLALYPIPSRLIPLEFSFDGTYLYQKIGNEIMKIEVTGNEKIRTM